MTRRPTIADLRALKVHVGPEVLEAAQALVAPAPHLVHPVEGAAS